MNLIYSNKFILSVKKFLKKNPDKIILLQRTLDNISNNPFDPVLRTHKLKGSLSDAWACRIDYKNRIVFSFEINEINNEKEILLINIGTHSEVY